MRSTLVLSALAAVVPALGAPTVVPVHKYAGPVKPNSYIIKFRDGASKGNVLDLVEQGPGSSLTYDYGNYGNGLDVIAATLDSTDLAAVQRQPGVESIEQDGIMSISYEEGIDGLPPVIERGEGPYNPPTGGYGGNGEGVTVYGIDTGIYTQHECFGGRAKWGKTFGNYSDADGNGHGTHTAGTAVGKGFGLATGANIFAVKVLSDAGSGSFSDVIAGVQWSAQDCAGRRCVAIMSLGGGSSQLVIAAVQAAIKQGVHFAVAAGNSNVDAKDTSPANVPEANTIGAVDANKKKAFFSNYGPSLDVWAPGVNIESAWIDGPASVKSLSGTSMATPHVAGILAVVLSEHSQYGRAPTPAELSQALTDNAEKDVVTFGTTDKEKEAERTSTHSFARLW